jgi:hypothetical protein
LPRRLGDDPLARAKNATAVKAARAMQTGEEGQVTLPAASYNDVFFERKPADAQVKPAVESAPEVPEISEVSELPQIREAAAAPDAQPPAAPAKSYLEELVANLNAAQPAPAQTADAKQGQSQESGGFFKRLFGKR